MKPSVLCVSVAALVGCSNGPPDTDEARAPTAFGAESGSVADSSGGSTDSVRLVARTAMSTDVEILSGHPDSAGKPFVIRIRELPGTIAPPHSHPVDEHITIVQGTWYFGTGTQFDSTALRALPTGSYAFAPSGTSMFAYAPELTIVQVHGIGPFHIHWQDSVQVLSVPGDEPAFRYRKNQSVGTPHGRGTVLEGYRSGSIIQYDVALPDGTRYMVQEHAIRATPGT